MSKIISDLRVRLKYHVLKIISRDWHIELPQSFNIRMLIKSWPWAFQSGLLIIWRMSFLEKWQWANRFFLSQVNCYGITHFSAQKELKISLFFLNQQCTCQKLCSCKLDIVSNILKSKESPRVTLERSKRVSQPEFTGQDL